MFRFFLFKAFLSCICYLYVLADCAVPESGHSLIKLITTGWYVVLFGVVFFPMTIARVSKYF